MSTDEKIIEFFSGHHRQSYSSGHVILSPGDEPAGIYYILEGQIRQYDIAENGDEIVVNVFRKGTHFPMTWAINNEENRWYFEAIDDVAVYIAPGDETMEFLHSNPDAMFAYLKRLCSGASGQQRRMAHLMGGSARSRVLYELIIEFKRFGEQDNGFHKVSISESELAAKAGLSREAVNRELSKLKNDRLIERKYREISVIDLEELEAALGPAI